jgi:hypothetical protein
MGTLGDMKRITTNNANGNFQNTTDINAIIQEIKQDVIGMDKHFNDYMKKVEDAARDYKKEISETMAKLTRIVN